MKRSLLLLLSGLALPTAVEDCILGNCGSKYEALQACEKWAKKVKSEIIKIFSYGKWGYDVGFIERNLNCNENSIPAVNEEIYKRLIVPFYILIISLVGSCLALKSELQNNFNTHKILVFLVGIIFIILSQILSKYSSEFILKNISILIMPFLISLMFYVLIQFKLKE